MNRLWLFIKERAYTVGVTAVALILLAACTGLMLKRSNSPIAPYLLAAEQESAVPASLKQNGEASFNLPEISVKDAPPIDLRHASCITDLVYKTEPSSTYVPSNQYNLSFVIGGSSTPSGLNGFYDINGDSLPDYIYTYNFSSNAYEGNVNVVYDTFQSCIYLNNGQGWSRAYRCHAFTKVNKDTGAFILGEYRGDCAGS